MPAKVAVVDDDPEIREGLKECLAAEGYEVLVVPNGLRLLSVLMVDRPDVILLDVRMQWIDGIELCRAIKRNGRYAGIPVVFVSAKVSREDVDRGFAAGAADYIKKPFQLDDLLARVRRATELTA